MLWFFCIFHNSFQKIVKFPFFVLVWHIIHIPRIGPNSFDKFFYNFWTCMMFVYYFKNIAPSVKVLLDFDDVQRNSFVIFFLLDTVLFASLNWQVLLHNDIRMQWLPFQFSYFSGTVQQLHPDLSAMPRGVQPPPYVFFPISLRWVFNAIVHIFKYKDIPVLNYHLYANESLPCTLLSPTYDIFPSIAIQNLYLITNSKSNKIEI